MTGLILPSSDSATFHYKGRDTLAIGIVLLLGALLFAVPAWIVGVIDQNLPATLIASGSFLTAVGGLYFAMRKLNSAERMTRERELQAHVETSALLRETQRDHTQLQTQFEEFRAAATADRRELRAEMATRDELIKNQGWKIEEQARQLATARILINTIEATLKAEGISHPKITAAYVAYNGVERRGTLEFDTP